MQVDHRYPLLIYGKFVVHARESARKFDLEQAASADLGDQIIASAAIRGWNRGEPI